MKTALDVRTFRRLRRRKGNFMIKRAIRTALCAFLALLLPAAAACAQATPRQQETEASPAVATAAPAFSSEPAQASQTAQGGETPIVVARATLPEQAEVQETDGATLRVLFINVRKADAILVQYGGKSALIDTGTEESAPYLLGALRFLYVTELDALFLTHTHKDHIGGVPALAKNVAVKHAYAPLYSENKKNGENRITLAAQEAGIPLTRLVAGDAIPLSNGAEFEVIGPRVFNSDDDNDNSLVLRLTVNGRTLLFTGDMQFAEEATLLSAAEDVSCDVLKVGNHGNPDATSDDFGRAAAPSIAVISTDTREDADSANPRVYEALAGAQVTVTQDTLLGALLFVAPDGAMTLYNAAPAHTSAELTLSVPNRDTQTVTLTNRGDAVDLSGWMLVSERGGECFTFPDGSTIGARATATIAPEGGTGDFVFSEERSPWHKKKADAAILYDRFGWEVARSE